MQLLAELNDRFCENLNKFLPEGRDACKEIDLKARAIAEIGQVASNTQGLQTHQRDIVPIFSEVFSDVILAVYFTACALDKPAQSVLRRALELGVAIVYLWDLPHSLWGWKSHDIDLNFNDMVDHLSKDGYRSFVVSLNPHYDGSNLVDHAEVKRLYRILSNTIHGKISTHESRLQDRFSYNAADWKMNLGLINRVETVLLRLFEKRFFDYFTETATRIPAINALLGE